MYVSIEWVSLCFYVRAAFRRGSAYSTEAGLKYYVVGSFGSAWMLFGMSLIYGWIGTLNRLEIERRRVGQYGTSGEWYMYRRGWRFVRGAFLLKLAGVPMHRWLADVYEGAPRASVYYFAVVPKRAFTMVRMRRVSVWGVQRSGEVDPRQTIYTETSSFYVTGRRRSVSRWSIAVGAVGGVTQRRRKRFRALSAIGHTGYMLLGVRTDTVEGVQGRRVYTRIYMLMTMVIWNRRRVVKRYETPLRGKRNAVGRKLREVTYRTDRYQLSMESPRLARLIRATCMSMAGVPPMAGFGAKRIVFSPMIGSSLYRFSCRAVLLSVIGAFNYVRMVKRMFFEENDSHNEEDLYVGMSKEVSRMMVAQTGVRTLLRRHPSALLLLTHRMAVQLVSW